MGCSFDETNEKRNINQVIDRFGIEQTHHPTVDERFLF